jgi:IrrE N-terminal-like domain
MVKYVPDRLHGFRERPHYEPGELDATFERLTVSFLKSKYGKAEFPFQTEDIKTFVERDVSDLDQYADLSPFGAGVEGVTEFTPGGKPKVLISEHLQAANQENRLRTTLTHEYGHVHLHRYLFDLQDRQPGLLAVNHKPNAIYCMRDTMVTAKKVDWLEWQAGYASGALLMPASYVRKTIAPIHEKFGIFGPVAAESDHGKAMIAAIVERFQVSKEAARVRLSVLDLLGTPRATGSLFS